MNVDELPAASGGGGGGDLATLDAFPSPLPSVSRASSRARSGKSIHWALTQYRNIHVDKKVRAHVVAS